MAYGDIHNQTGTICKAQSDETCPLSTGDGHSSSLEEYAQFHGVDAPTLESLVTGARMTPKAALELMGSGEMVDTPPPLTKAPYVPREQRTAAPQEATSAPVERQLTQERLVDLLGPIPEQNQRPDETPQERYDRELHQYKIAMVEYENQMLSNYEAAMVAHQASPFAPRPDAPPFRTVYPKAYEAYDGTPKEFLPDSLPAELANHPGGPELWQEYLRKRKQLGDVRNLRKSGSDRVYYL